MKASALWALGLVACGGHVADVPTSGQRFIDAVCAHVDCPGWPERQVCEYSYEAALERLGVQDEACIENATALLEQPGCGPEVQTIADDVVNGKCTR